MPEIDRRSNLTKFATSAQTASLMGQATTIEFATRASHKGLPTLSRLRQNGRFAGVFHSFFITI
jgi:hypothetical protein